MSFEEFGPIFQELTKNPIAFMGGFVSGVLRLNLQDDPVKTWLEKQGGSSSSSSTPSGSSKSSGPQSIAIE